MKMPGLYKIFQEKWEQFQTCWIISDTHFGDVELREGLSQRPTDLAFVESLKRKIGKKDILIHLGDVGDIEMIRQLKGYKVLVCGNHDAGRTIYEEVFDEVYNGPLIISDRIILSHEPIPNINWAFNIHGHIHDFRHKNDKYHYCVCADLINYTPINFAHWIKEGHLSGVQPIHREIIDRATERKKKRGKVK